MTRLDKEILQEAFEIILNYPKDILCLREQKKIINRILKDNIKILEERK